MPNSLEIAGVLYFEFDIEGKPVGTDSVDTSGLLNLVNEVIIHEHAAYALPTGSISFVDQNAIFLKNNALQDGTRIKLKLGKDRESAREFKFRIFEGDWGQQHNFIRLTYALVYDCPAYLSRTVRRAYPDKTSYEALELLAQDCKLQFDDKKPVKTDDKQTWLGIGVTNAEFAANIAAAGYKDEESCLAIAVTGDGVLRYVDLIAQLKEEPKQKFGIPAVNEDDMTPVLESLFYGNSGLRNHWMNYGHYRFFHDVAGDAFELDKVKIKVDPKGQVKYLPINSEQRETVKWARVDSDIFDPGNVHQHYQEAQYQNTRLLAAFSECASLMVIENNTKGITLFDPVELHVGDSTGFEGSTEKMYQEPLSASGTYVVFAKTTIMHGGALYGERIEVMRPTVANDGKTKLLSLGA